MRVFIAGISGTGMGPLALFARGAGIEVCGTDLHQGDIYPELAAAGIEMRIGADAQDGKFLAEQQAQGGIDWFVHTSAIAKDQAELQLARKLGLKVSKRDDFTAFLLEKLGLKLVAVAGTHGKTTTTAMLIWAAQQLKISAAYIVGSTLSFAPSGAYHKGDQFFIYEADEYDRNFLKFHPWLAVLPFVSYDHPDIYPTLADYQAAFRQFIGQSQAWICGDEVDLGDQPTKTSGGVDKTRESETVRTFKTIGGVDKKAASSLTKGENGTVERTFTAELFTLAGAARRQDAALAATAIQQMVPTVAKEEIVRVLNDFPGVGRRFERLAEGIYTDYAHHPEEIAATLEVAREEAERKGFSGVVAIYEPHQNTRQHEVRKGYRRAFLNADKVFWLPTYLTREDPALPVLTPADLTAELENQAAAETATANDELFERILAERRAGKLVLLMTAGPADGWLRRKLDDSAAK